MNSSGLPTHQQVFDGWVDYSLQEIWERETDADVKAEQRGLRAIAQEYAWAHGLSMSEGIWQHYGWEVGS
jgi:hypothetical protein